jgi:hypothetical protein
MGEPMSPVGPTRTSGYVRCRAALGVPDTMSLGAIPSAWRRVASLAFERHAIVLGPCACRKSKPDILVMQPAENWAAKNVPG